MVRLVARWQGDGRVESLGGRYGGVRISKGVKEYQQISKSSILFGGVAGEFAVVLSKAWVGGLLSGEWGEAGWGGYSCGYQKILSGIIQY